MISPPPGPVVEIHAGRHHPWYERAGLLCLLGHKYGTLPGAMYGEPCVLHLCLRCFKSHPENFRR